VDVTQYAAWPATSGIQRVLANLAAEWPSHRVAAHFGFLQDGTFVVGPLHALGERMRGSFASGDSMAAGSASDRVDTERDILRSLSDSEVAVDSLEASFDGYMLPEPTLDAASISLCSRLLHSSRTSTFIVYYDPFPMTRPELFPDRADESLTVTRYHRLAGQAENVAFISDSVRREFEERLARRKVRNALVVHPGVHAATGGRRDLPTGLRRFTMVGTVEPRKGHRVVLDAFERAWAAGRDYELVLLGAPGWEAPDLLERLDAHARAGRIVWHQHPGDDVTGRSLETCAGLLFPSEDEGYGLPPLEALVRRCPVVVSARLPSIQRLGPAGQIRLHEVTIESIGDALDVLADPVRNLELRDAIDALSLPTWAELAGDIEEWVFESIAAHRSAAGA
jgi:glycosyltransferase involved in cell wall biosynthesis